MDGNETEHNVSTDSQRLALEAMSAQLVHKLNAMIREQEERVRIFSEQHHSTLPVPQVPKPELTSYTTPQVSLPQPTAAQVSTHRPASLRANVTPPPPASRKTARNDWRLNYPDPANAEQKPLQTVPKNNTAQKQEDSNIGIGMIIFAMVGIIMLLRACT